MVRLVSLRHLWTSTVTEALPCCSLNHISFFFRKHATTHHTTCCFFKCIHQHSVRSPLPCWLTLGVGAVLPGAGRCGAQQQQPGDRTGANRSGGEHHTERGGAYGERSSTRTGLQWNRPQPSSAQTGQERSTQGQWSEAAVTKARGSSACARGNCSPHECKRA